MRKNVKKMAAVLLSACMAGCLFACGGAKTKDASKESRVSENKNSTVSEKNSSMEKSTVEASGEPIEVVFWHSFSGTTGEALEKIIKAYNDGPGKEKNISVNLVFQGYEGTDKVILAYQTNDTENAPDINVGLTSTIPSMTDIDWSVAVQEYLSDSGISKDTFYPALVRSCTYQGKMMAIPFANSIPLLYYNTEMLKEAGFAEPPKTMDELVEYVKALTVKKGDEVERYGLNMQTKRYQMVEFCVSQNKNAFFGDNEGGRLAPMTKLTADTDGTMKSYLEKIDKLVKTGGYKFIEDKINEEFAQGLSAMVIMSSSRLGTMDSLMAGKYMTAFLPKVNEADDGGASVGGSCLNLFNRGDKARTDAAWDVIKYLVSPENQAEFSMASGYIPVNKASEDLDIMKNYYTEKPHYKVALEQMKASDETSQEPLDLTYNEINGIITESMLEFCRGNISVDEAVKKIADGCNQSLDEYHKAND